MNDDSTIARAKHDLAYAHERRTSLAAPFVSALPVSGAAISVLAAQMGQTTVDATDKTAGRLDELQFDLGEGPCWDALTHRRAVLEPDVQSAESTRYPQFTQALRGDAVSSSVRAMFAFPLVVGSLGIGAVDLWAGHEGSLDEEQVADASSLAEIAARQVLRKVLGDVPELTSRDDSIRSRREIHQATGMVLVQLDVSAEDAALLLRAHAFATNRSLGSIANDVVEHRLDFTPTSTSHDGRD